MYHAYFIFKYFDFVLRSKKYFLADVNILLAAQMDTITKLLGPLNKSVYQLPNEAEMFFIDFYSFQCN